MAVLGGGLKVSVVNAGDGRRSRPKVCVWGSRGGWGTDK